MAAIEVLAPLRIETRFYPPDASTAHWRLRLRVHPDEFSIARAPPPPSPQELDRLEDALTVQPVGTLVETAAFATLAMAVGAPRALWLVRRFTLIDADGTRHVDRSAQAARDPAAAPRVHLPEGLPARLDVWLVSPGGATEHAATLLPDRAVIAEELDLASFADEASVSDADLPLRWWTSFRHACDVGLATEIKLGTSTPVLDAIVVAGTGDTAPDALIDAHAAGGRLAVLAPGTPTNTVEGEATVEMGRNAGPWHELLGATVESQPGTAALLQALTTGGTFAPLMGGEFDPAAWRRPLVTALWPALWGRSMRDVHGAAAREHDIAEWAQNQLCPEGPFPAIRVGSQPYGVLPTSALGRWVSVVEDPVIEACVRDWAVDWRDRAAQAIGDGGVVGADTAQLVSVMGETAPCAHWSVRGVMPMDIASALATAADQPPREPTAWDIASAKTLAGRSVPWRPLSPFTGLFELDPQRARFDKPDILKALITATPESLRSWQLPLGLLGHLLRESLLLARVAVGLAHRSLEAGASVDPDAALPPWPDPFELFELAIEGNDVSLAQLDAAGDPGASIVVRRFETFRRAALDVVDGWANDSERVWSALMAMLDTASHRADPWATGVANRRLQVLAARQTPRFLGAYGWVEQPRPHASAPGATLAPGPTPAGLLHAPSYAQALTSAVMRDAALRNQDDERWHLELDSRKVRAARRLADRVRLGVHPYEALGLEVERIVGGWDEVRELRTRFPLTAGSDVRRTCDGARVLRAILHKDEALPATLQPLLDAGLADRLKPLDSVLDTYADLLVADGVHALVGGRADLAQAAMDAAAGLFAPPEMRAIHTPRASTEVRVSTWLFLEDVAVGDTPLRIADPSFASFLDERVGPPSQWRWQVGEPASTITLADLGLHGAQLLSLGTDEIDALLRRDQAATAPVRSITGAACLEQARRYADLFGGGEEDPPVAATGSSRDDARSLPDALRDAMRSDLQSRWTMLQAAAKVLVDEATAWQPGEPVEDFQRRFLQWSIAGVAEPPRAAATLSQRFTGAVPDTVNGWRRALRTALANTRLPVLASASRALAMTLPAIAGSSTVQERSFDHAQWLEVIAAVRPRLALLEALQLEAGEPAAANAPWDARLLAYGDSPWSSAGDVLVAFGPAIVGHQRIAIAALDRWTDAIPSDQHATAAAFGFNAPKSRPPQAILLGVPADPEARMEPDELLELVLETRSLVKARAARPDLARPRVATPSVVLTPTGPFGFLEDWP
ncbi:hypothetical protein [Pseudoxanthomonas putridarboris]|uniref:Uncharacterized protein n=1 Tax=Pseudoxanthomonas putridarboris TaxID=752605 RepID=A0ABU9IZM6_9GAMM